MKFTTLSRRTAAAGAASALVAGALVAATTTAAEAAAIQNDYTCTSAIGTFPLVLDSDAPGLTDIPGTAAGFGVPAGLLSVTNIFTIPDAVHTQLAGAGVENLTVPEYAGSLGPADVPVEGVAVTVSGMTQNADTTWSTASDEGTGTNEAFETPAAGTYDVVSPESMEIIADLGGTPVPVDCTLTPGTEAGAYHTLVISKNESTSAAKATNSPVKKGKAAKVAVTVAADNETPGGKVILKKGKKTLDSANLNDKGKATLSSKALKVGKNELKVVYKGDGYTVGSSDKVTVKVTN